MAERHCVTTTLLIFTVGVLVREVQAKIEIVEPYPNNIYPIEGTEGKATCVAYDSDSNATRPARIDFIRRNGFGAITNLTDPKWYPRVTFESDAELGGRRLLTTMIIKNVTKEDDTSNKDLGRYECWAFRNANDKRPEAKHGFSVDVILRSSIPKIAVTDDIVANHGDKISLTCNVTDRGLKNAAVLKEITWMKEGEILERVKNPNPDDPEGTLRPFVIDSVETEDGGLYICVLLVLLKKQTQKNITGNVNISVKPRFNGEISDSEVKMKKGEVAKFTCAADGYPLQVEFKRQRKIDEKLHCINNTEDRYQIEQKDRNAPYVLTIEDLMYEDRGKYYCCLPTNCSNSKHGCQEWTLRVKDPLGALWPFIGIIVEAIILFLIIFIAGKVKDRKERAAQKDDRVEFSYSSTDDGDRGQVRLRKVDTVNA